MQIIGRLADRRRLIGALAAAITVPALLLTSSPSQSADGWTHTRLQGARGYEMGVDVGADGTVFVDEPSGLGTHSKLFRSKDAGRSFARLNFSAPYSRYPGGGDSDVVLSHDGRVYFLDLWIGSNSVSVSKDNGETWSHGSPFTTLPLSDRQWIALGERDPVTGHDTVYATYSLIQPPFWAMFARSRDSGQTWDFHRPVPALTSGSTGSTGSLVSDGKFIAFSFEQNGRLYVATSSDAGDNWEYVEANYFQEARADIPSTAVDGTDLYAAYVDRNQGSVKLAWSQDRGAKWELPKTIATGGTNVFAWVAARNGKVAVAWYHSDSNEINPDSVQPNESWTVMYSESLDRGQTWSEPEQVSPSKVKTGPICTQGLGCNANRELGDFLQVTIGPDGKSYVAYGDVYFDGDNGAKVSKQN